MNSLESAVYTVLDFIIFSDAALAVFLLGGFALCPILSTVAFAKKVSLRNAVLLSGFIPLIVLGYSLYFDLFVQGRDFNDLAPLSPVALAILAPVMSLQTDKRNNRATAKSTWLLLPAQLWTILVLWLATNSGFMGANC